MRVLIALESYIIMGVVVGQIRMA